MNLIRHPVRLHGILRKIISLNLVVCFSWTTAVQAAPTDISQPKPIQTYKDNVIISSLASAVEIPESMGSIKNRYVADPEERHHRREAAPALSPVILHIQDAHSSYEAQTNIKKILRHLVQEYRISTVFLEGAADEIHADFLRYFDEESRNEKLADQLGKEGILGGAELFLLDQTAAKDHQGVRVFGIEDLPLYRKNLETFREVMKKKTAADRFLNDLKDRILTLSSHVFGKELRGFFREWLFYQDNPEELVRQLEIIETYAQNRLKIDFKDPKTQSQWPQLVRYFSLRNAEKALDAGLIESEKGSLLKWLAENKVPVVYADMLEAILSGKKINSDGFENPRHFVERFYDETSAKGFSFEKYPAVSRQLGAWVLRSEIRAEELFSEIEKLTGLLLAQMTKNGESRVLLDIYRDYLLLKKLWSLELVSEDYSRILKDRETLRPSHLVARLNEIDAAAQTNKKMKVGPSPDRLFDLALRFYADARAREKSMYDKMIGRLREYGEANAVLITGGFHEAGLSALFAENKMSYVQMVPHVSGIQKDSRYLDLMTLKSDTIAKTSDVNLPRMTDGRGFASLMADFPEYGRLYLGIFAESVLASMAQMSRGDDGTLQGLIGEFNRHGQAQGLSVNPDTGVFELNGTPYVFGSDRVLDVSMMGPVYRSLADAQSSRLTAASFPAESEMSAAVTDRSEARVFSELKMDGTLTTRDIEGLLSVIDGLIAQGQRLLRENKDVDLTVELVLENRGDSIVNQFSYDITSTLAGYFERNDAMDLILGAWAEAHEERGQIIGLEHIRDGITMLRALKAELSRSELRVIDEVMQFAWNHPVWTGVLFYGVGALLYGLHQKLIAPGSKINPKLTWKAWWQTLGKWGEVNKQIEGLKLFDWQEPELRGAVNHFVNASTDRLQAISELPDLIVKARSKLMSRNSTFHDWKTALVYLSLYGDFEIFNQWHILPPIPGNSDEIRSVLKSSTGWVIPRAADILKAAHRVIAEISTQKGNVPQLISMLPLMIDKTIRRFDELPNLPSDQAFIVEEAQYEQALKYLLEYGDFEIVFHPAVMHTETDWVTPIDPGAISAAMNATDWRPTEGFDPSPYPVEREAIDRRAVLEILPPRAEARKETQRKPDQQKHKQTRTLGFESLEPRDYLSVDPLNAAASLPATTSQAGIPWSMAAYHDHYQIYYGNRMPAQTPAVSASAASLSVPAVQEQVGHANPNLTLKDVNLSAPQGLTAVSSPNNVASVSQTAPGIYRLSYSDGSFIYSGSGGFTYGASGSDYLDISERQKIVVGLRGQILSSEGNFVTMAVTDKDGKSVSVQLSNIEAQTEKFWAVPASSLPGLDTGHIAAVTFGISGYNVAGSYLEIFTSVPTGWTQAISNPNYAFHTQMDNFGNIDLYLTDLSNPAQSFLVGGGSQIRHNPVLYDVSPDGKVVVVAYHESGPVLGQLSWVSFYRTEDLRSNKQADVSTIPKPSDAKSIHFEGSNIIVTAQVRGPLYDQNGTDIQEKTFTVPIADVAGKMTGAVMTPSNSDYYSVRRTVSNGSKYDIYQISTGQLVATVRASETVYGSQSLDLTSVSAPDISASGQYLIVGYEYDSYVATSGTTTHGQSVSVFDLHGALLRSIQIPGQENMVSVRFRDASNAVEVIFRNGTIKFYDAETGNEVPAEPTVVDNAAVLLPVEFDPHATGPQWVVVKDRSGNELYRVQLENVDFVRAYDDGWMVADFRGRFAQLYYNGQPSFYLLDIGAVTDSQRLSDGTLMVRGTSIDQRSNDIYTLMPNGTLYGKSEAFAVASPAADQNVPLTVLPLQMDTAHNIPWLWIAEPLNDASQTYYVTDRAAALYAADKDRGLGWVLGSGGTGDGDLSQTETIVMSLSSDRPTLGRVEIVATFYNGQTSWQKKDSQVVYLEPGVKRYAIPVSGFTQFTAEDLKHVSVIYVLQADAGPVTILSEVGGSQVNVTAHRAVGDASVFQISDGRQLMLLPGEAAPFRVYSTLNGQQLYGIYLDDLTYEYQAGIWNAQTGDEIAAALANAALGSVVETSGDGRYAIASQQAPGQITLFRFNEMSEPFMIQEILVPDFWNLKSVVFREDGTAVLSDDSLNVRILNLENGEIYDALSGQWLNTFSSLNPTGWVVVDFPPDDPIHPFPQLFFNGLPSFYLLGVTDVIASGAKSDGTFAVIGTGSYGGQVLYRIKNFSGRGGEFEPFVQPYAELQGTDLGEIASTGQVLSREIPFGSLIDDMWLVSVHGADVKKAPRGVSIGYDTHGLAAGTTMELGGPTFKTNPVNLNTPSLEFIELSLTGTENLARVDVALKEDETIEAKRVTASLMDVRAGQDNVYRIPVAALKEKGLDQVQQLIFFVVEPDKSGTLNVNLLNQPRELQEPAQGLTDADITRVLGSYMPKTTPTTSLGTGEESWIVPNGNLGFTIYVNTDAPGNLPDFAGAGFTMLDVSNLTTTQNIIFGIDVAAGATLRSPLKIEISDLANGRLAKFHLLGLQPGTKQYYALPTAWLDQNGVDRTHTLRMMAIAEGLGQSGQLNWNVVPQPYSELGLIIPEPVQTLSREIPVGSLIDDMWIIQVVGRVAKAPRGVAIQYDTRAFAPGEMAELGGMTFKTNPVNLQATALEYLEFSLRGSENLAQVDVSFKEDETMNAKHVHATLANVRAGEDSVYRIPVSVLRDWGLSQVQQLVFSLADPGKVGTLHVNLLNQAREIQDPAQGLTDADITRWLGNYTTWTTQMVSLGKAEESWIVPNESLGFTIYMNTDAPGDLYDFAGGGFISTERPDFSSLDSLVFGINVAQGATLRSPLKIEIADTENGNLAKYHFLGIQPGAHQLYALPTAWLDQNNVARTHHFRFMVIAEGFGQQGQLQLDVVPTVPSLEPAGGLTAADVTAFENWNAEKVAPMNNTRSYAVAIPEGVRVHADNSIWGWSGGGMAFSSPLDLSNLNQLVFGLKGDVARVRFQISGTNGRETSIGLTGIRSDLEQYYAIPTAMLASVDLSSVQSIYFIVEDQYRIATIDVRTVPAVPVPAPASPLMASKAVDQVMAGEELLVMDEITGKLLEADPLEQGPVRSELRNRGEKLLDAYFRQSRGVSFPAVRETSRAASDVLPLDLAKPVLNLSLAWILSDDAVPADWSVHLNSTLAQARLALGPHAWLLDKKSGNVPIHLPIPITADAAAGDFMMWPLFIQNPDDRLVFVMRGGTDQAARRLEADLKDGARKLGFQGELLNQVSVVPSLPSQKGFAATIRSAVGKKRARANSAVLSSDKALLEAVGLSRSAALLLSSAELHPSAALMIEAVLLREQLPDNYTVKMQMLDDWMRERGLEDTSTLAVNVMRMLQMLKQIAASA